MKWKTSDNHCSGYGSDNMACQAPEEVFVTLETGTPAAWHLELP